MLVRSKLIYVDEYPPPPVRSSVNSIHLYIFGANLSILIHIYVQCWVIHLRKVFFNIYSIRLSAVFICLIVFTDFQSLSTCGLHFSIVLQYNIYLCQTEESDLLMSSLCKINALLGEAGVEGEGNTRGARAVDFKQGTWEDGEFAAMKKRSPFQDTFCSRYAPA